MSPGPTVFGARMAGLDRRAGAQGGPGSRRMLDPHFGVPAVKLFPGEHYVTRAEDEMIVTVLGSCVAACMRDPVARVGGMNHFMLPESAHGAWGDEGASLRYGNFAMERLINDLLRAGGRRERLEIKLFGGGNVIAGVMAIGHRNADFALSYLAEEGLAVAAADLRGSLPRRVHYAPATGAAFVQVLRRASDAPDLASERRYQAALRAEAGATALAGDVELFG